MKKQLTIEQLEKVLSFIEPNIVAHEALKNIKVRNWFRKYIKSFSFLKKIIVFINTGVVSL